MAKALVPATGKKLDFSLAESKKPLVKQSASERGQSKGGEPTSRPSFVTGDPAQFQDPDLSIEQAMEAELLAQVAPPQSRSDVEELKGSFTPDAAPAPRVAAAPQQKLPPQPATSVKPLSAKAAVPQPQAHAAIKKVVQSTGSVTKMKVPDAIENEITGLLEEDEEAFEPLAVDPPKEEAPKSFEEIMASVDEVVGTVIPKALMQEPEKVPPAMVALVKEITKAIESPPETATVLGGENQKYTAPNAVLSEGAPLDPEDPLYPMVLAHLQRKGLLGAGIKWEYPTPKHADGSPVRIEMAVTLRLV